MDYNILKGKHIVLGITGSIAAYKAAALTRLFVKAGAEVQVVMTSAAKEFIAPLTLSTLSGKPVISEFFTANTGEWHSHVDIGLWANAMVIAPATAATIGKMVTGVADNMLITTYLSAKSKVFIAPAMDLDMYRHPSTQRNIQTLQNWGNIIIEASSGELASHLIGKGRMQEPETIIEEVRKYFLTQAIEKKGKRIVVTAGPTHEKIDCVRFIGNYSSGLMGISICQALIDQGYDVDLVMGPSNLEIADQYKDQIAIHQVTTACEMDKVASELFAKADGAIFAAAVADYRPETIVEGKIKREKTHSIAINLIANPDIAAHIGTLKQQHQRTIGFALEADLGIEEAKRKLTDKNLDAIILNSLSDKGAGFGVETNKITIISKDKTLIEYPLKSKQEVAQDIVKHLNTLWN